jgi:hypothetical protein
VRLSGSLDGVSFMDFNLLGDTAWAAKRCCLEMATGDSRWAILGMLRAERGRLEGRRGGSSAACVQAARRDPSPPGQIPPRFATHARPGSPASLRWRAVYVIGRDAARVRMRRSVVHLRLQGGAAACRRS